LSVATALAIAACGASGDDGSGGDAAAGAQAATGDENEPSADDGNGSAADASAIVVEVERVEPSPREDVLSGLGTFGDPLDELPAPTIDLSRLRSGGPPPDGIPSIDEPVFYSAASVDYLSPTSPVLAVEIDGDARAYPLEVVIWHEIVNDTVGGVPVAVQYCPLCNSATVVDRRIEGRVLEFGVSGLLLNSSLVMYDRQTETLWSHFAGRPLYGLLGEAELVDYPSTIVGFEAWRAANPDGLVLSRRTGFDRSYGQNPYPGYDDVDSSPFLFEGDVDGRYTPMTRVVGVAAGEGTGTDGGAAEATAFPLVGLRAAGVMTSTLEGSDIVAFWVSGSSSALDTFDVAAGVDVGATGVFVPEVDGQQLTFSSIDGVITDDETGSTWDIFGKATAGELTGSQLEQLVHIDTFWFAWITFHPDSAVAGG
jgi:hypothetical protein